MRKNVFIKSMLRQPLRTTLLVVLIGLATFAFVLRTAEFVIVRQQIYATADYYRTTGFIGHPLQFGDVSVGIEVLAENPFIAYEDSRRAAEGIMSDMLNADVGGMRHTMANTRAARLQQPRLTEAIFYAYVEYSLAHQSGWFGRGTTIGLYVTIDEVLVGHPEYIVPGQQMFLTFEGGGLNYNNALDDIIQNTGQRYLFRAVYIQQFPPLDLIMLSAEHGPLVPVADDGVSEGRENSLTLWPLTTAPMTSREHIWYWHVPGGQSADFTLPELAHLPGEIERISRDQRSMLLQTTRDMQSIPGINETFELMEGRLVNREDYLNQNPVAVIDQNFARMRNVGIGDVLTFSVPRQQHFVGVLSLPRYVTPLVRVEREYIERYEDAYEITVEVVGITRFIDYTRLTSQSLLVFIPDSVLPEGVGILWRQYGTGYEEHPLTGEMLPIRIDLDPIVFGLEHRPDVWYSFVLADARDELEFAETYRYHLDLLGYRLVVHFAEAGNFWASANPILLSITFNAALFWLVLLMVLLLVAFLFIRQRRRDFAIKRTLGISAKKVYMHLILAALLFGLPAVAVGGYIGWGFALNEAERTLTDFETTYDESLALTPFEAQWLRAFGELPKRGVPYGRREIHLDIDLDNTLPLALTGITLGMLMIFILCGGFAFLRLPVLAQLQGNATKPTAKTTKETKGGVYFRKTPQTLPSDPIPRAVRFGGGMRRFVLRHMFRSPVKTGLGVMVAVFFVLFLGWLVDSMNQTEAEIDRLYDTTVVWSELSPIHQVVFRGPRPPVGQNFSWGEGLPDDALPLPSDLFPSLFDAYIRRVTADRLRVSEFTQEHYLEAGFERSFIIPANADGELPHNWRHIINIPHPNIPLVLVRNLHPYDHTLGISCIRTFQERHSVSEGLYRAGALMSVDETVAEALQERVLENVIIGFAEGFNEDSFNELTPSGNIPVVIATATMQRRRLQLGDVAYLGYANWGDNWQFVKVEVIGMHNGIIPHKNLAQAMLLPIEHFSRMFIGFQYITAEFGINPEQNRTLNNVRHEWEIIINPVEYVPTLTLTIHEEELRTVAGALGQVLMLLRLMYPVVVTLAVVIGFGLGVLLMLQNGINAAILRVLGTSAARTRFILWSEQLVVNLAGLVIGLVVLFVIGLGLPVVFVLAGYYLAGCMAGCAVGTIIVTRKPPLDLLQVKE
jgi:hypothetical protein